MLITDTKITVLTIKLTNYNRSLDTMRIFGTDYEPADLLIIIEDLDMNDNRIRELRNPRDAKDAISKLYMNKRIEYSTKDLEMKKKYCNSNTYNYHTATA